MKIGIIGAGNIGETLARKLAAAGHAVKLANSKGPQTLQRLADEIGATAVAAAQAAVDVDAIILSIPFGRVPELAGLIAGVPPYVPVIDTSNYYSHRDGVIAEVEDGMPESLWVSKQLGRTAIKAFNNILAHTLAELGRPEGMPGRLAIAVAGDNGASKQVAMRFVSETGFDPVDAGSLEESWRQQPYTPAYCCDYAAETMRKALAAAVKGAPRKDEQLRDGWAALGPNPGHADIVALNRSLNPLEG